MISDASSTSYFLVGHESIESNITDSASSVPPKINSIHIDSQQHGETRRGGGDSQCADRSTNLER
jgi:hypothetical protein